ncbi:MAG: MMPL family transporter [Verrucomicrobiales bacterium]|nr:MMPL family transporter [Verrucomicrobiales bacterium]
MQWLLDHGRVPFLILVGGLTLFLGYHCLQLEVDRDNRSMDADDVEQEERAREFREVFRERESILVAVHRDDVLKEKGQGLLSKLVSEFQGLDGVDRVISVVDFDFAVPETYRGILVSDDGNTAGIRILLDAFDDGGDRKGELIASIYELAERHSDGETSILLSGLPIQKNEAGELVRRDQQIFAPLSLLVLGLILLFVTRRFSGMLFPLLVSAITICWTLGIYSLSGHSLNMITSLLPPVIMTLSVATTIHIYLDWLNEPGTDNRARILKAVKHLSRPCLFTSVTTAIGFLSLLISDTPAVRLFGMFAALGVAISYVLGVVGIAVGLSFLKGHEKGIPCLKHASEAHRLLDRIANLTVRHPWKVILGAALISVIGVYGSSKIESDTDLLHYMGDDHPLVVDTEFIDEEIAGTSALELYLESRSPIDSTTRFLEFEEAIRKHDPVRQVFGLGDFLPEQARVAEESGVSLADILERVDATSYISEDRIRTRVTVFTEAVGTRVGAELVDAIKGDAEEILGESYDLHFVGGFYRVIVESNQLVASQLKSFLVAIVLILIAIGIVFRSVLFSLLAIIPNVVPLLLTAAVMGFSGIAMSTGTAMIASVVIGIAVDDTIHYLSAYRKSGQEGAIAAIRKTTCSTGFVLLSTTMALSAGFWVAIFGSFEPTTEFALLAGLTMWFALLCDLLVLPAFLRIAMPGASSSSAN